MKVDKMKLIRFTNLMLAGAVISLAAVGCKHNPQGVTAIPSRTGSPEDTSKGGTLSGTGTGETTAVAQPNPADFEHFTRDETKFESDIVHFAYDSAVIRSGEKSKIEDVASFMKSNPEDALEVQGHCDERGTDQYNYALGERRALAVREALIADGVPGDKIMTVSFGRSRPIDTGHSEEAHARNRRGMFILLTPPAK
jgi:peptidoglycan-associated lipoprotein